MQRQLKPINLIITEKDLLINKLKYPCCDDINSIELFKLNILKTLK